MTGTTVINDEDRAKVRAAMAALIARQGPLSDAALEEIAAILAAARLQHRQPAGPGTT